MDSDGQCSAKQDVKGLLIDNTADTSSQTMSFVVDETENVVAKGRIIKTTQFIDIVIETTF